MEVTAAALHIIASQAVLIPPVLDGRHVSRENQKEGWQRSELVDPAVLLDLHPLFDPLGVPAPPPLYQIYDHDAGVKVTGFPAIKCAGKPLVRPESGGEVFGEVGVAVLGRPDGSGTEAGGPEPGNIIDDDEIRVQVDDPLDAGLQQIRQVVAGVIERLLQRLPHRRGDQAPYHPWVEVVDPKLQLRESGLDQDFQIRLRDEEVEEDTLRAQRVLQDRVDGGD